MLSYTYKSINSMCVLTEDNNEIEDLEAAAALLLICACFVYVFANSTFSVFGE